MSSNQENRTIGAFDIRFIIAGLLGLYGVILTLLGIFNASESELERGDGLNINLWAGLGMIVVALLFAIWARQRPLVVPESALPDSPPPDSTLPDSEHGD